MPKAVPIAFFPDFTVRSEDMPIVTEADTFFEIVKSGILRNFKVAFWSKKLRRWIYVLYDETEFKVFSEKHPVENGILLMELWRLGGLNIDAVTLQLIMTARAALKARIKAIRE